MVECQSLLIFLINKERAEELIFIDLRVSTYFSQIVSRTTPFFFAELAHIVGKGRYTTHVPIRGRKLTAR